MYVILFHTFIIAIYTFLGFQWKKYLLCEGTIDLGTNLSSFIMCAGWRQLTYLLYAPCSTPSLSVFCGPFPTHLGSWAPQSPALSALHLHLEDFFSTLPNEHKTLLLRWNVWLCCANNYSVYFNLKPSQLNDLYLWLHFLAHSAVLDTLKSNFLHL